jgi:hypothetical protein
MKLRSRIRQLLSDLAGSSVLATRCRPRPCQRLPPLSPSHLRAGSVVGRGSVEGDHEHTCAGYGGQRPRLIFADASCSMNRWASCIDVSTTRARRRPLTVPFWAAVSAPRGRRETSGAGLVSGPWRRRTADRPRRAHWPQHVGHPPTSPNLSRSHPPFEFSRSQWSSREITMARGVALWIALVRRSRGRMPLCRGQRILCPVAMLS